MKPQLFLVLFILTCLSTIHAQNPLYLIDRFDSQNIQNIHINADKSAVILGTIRGQRNRNNLYHFADLYSGVMTSYSELPDFNIYRYSDVYSRDDKFFLSGAEIFQCDIFIQRPYLTIVDRIGNILFSDEYHRETIDEPLDSGNFDRDRYFFGFGEDHILLFSDHQLLLLDYNGNPMGAAQSHSWSDLQDVISLSTGFLLIRNTVNIFVNDQGSATGDENTIDFGEIIDQDDLHIYSLMDDAIHIFNKADLHTRSELDLPPGELLDINFSLEGVAVLMEDNDVKKAYHYDLDLQLIKELSASNLDRWSIGRVAISDQDIIGVGTVSSALSGAVIIDKVDANIDFSLGRDVAIRDLIINLVDQEFWNIEIEYSYTVENLTSDTIYSAVILSQALSQYGCNETARLRNTILSDHPLLPFESRVITGNTSYFSPGELGEICIYLRSPNNHTDPDISNNSTCSLINSTFNNSVDNLISVYRSDPNHVAINLNDFNSDHPLYISIYNSLGQLIMRFDLSSDLTEVKIPNLGNSIYYYQISDKKDRIKTGKLF